MTAMARFVFTRHALYDNSDAQPTSSDAFPANVICFHLLFRSASRVFHHWAISAASLAYPRGAREPDSLI